MKKSTNNDIELRSEKVRNLLGETPPTFPYFLSYVLCLILIQKEKAYCNIY